MIENYSEWSLYISTVAMMKNAGAMRDYDAEDEFIGNMEELGEFFLHDPYIVVGNNPQQVGFYLALPKDISDDNKIGEVQ